MDINTEFVDFNEGWKKLKAELDRINEIDLNLFETIFTGTYQILKQYSNDSRIDKEHIELIVNAYLFVNSAAKGLDFQYRAALVLTERMLDCYALGSGTDDGTEVYILTMRKEVHIDFNDVEASLKTLSTALEEDFWGKR